MKNFTREFKVTTDIRVLDFMRAARSSWTLDSIYPVPTIANLDAAHHPTVVCDIRHLR